MKTDVNRHSVYKPIYKRMKQIDSLNFAGFMSWKIKTSNKSMMKRKRLINGMNTGNRIKFYKL